MSLWISEPLIKITYKIAYLHEVERTTAVYSIVLCSVKLFINLSFIDTQNPSALK